MTILVDTNVLLRAAEPGHGMHRAAVDAVAALRTAGHDLRVVPQVLYEFWAVSHVRPL
ncbi:MAG: hypothetical protein K2P78_10865 [Gemmataceae bacterium]|nr:hypothetical protein [Gemmataceae bacterium]